jgi:hypothetical protein
MHHMFVDSYHPFLQGRFADFSRLNQKLNLSLIQLSNPLSIFQNAYNLNARMHPRMRAYPY